MRTIPSVRRGTPDANEAGEYRQENVAGATIYVHNSLEEFTRIEIDAERTIFGHRLVLRGAEKNDKGCCV